MSGDDRPSDGDDHNTPVGRDGYTRAVLKKIAGIGDKFKESIKKGLNRHPFVFIMKVSVLLFVVPFVIVLVMRAFDYYCSLSWFRLEDGFNVWFAFWGSYVGAAATVLVGIGTIYLSMKIDEMSRSQSGLQIATGFHKLEIDQCRLYDCYQKKCKAPLKVLEKFNSRKRYILEIRAKESFPPYFDIELQEFTWKKEDKPKKDKPPIESPCFVLDKEEMEVVVENNEQLLFYIMFDKKDSDINYFYHIHYYEPKGMFPYEKRRIMHLRLCLKNKLRIYDEPGHPGDDIRIDLRIQVENGCLSWNNGLRNTNRMKAKTSFGIPLVIQNRKIDYVEGH